MLGCNAFLLNDECQVRLGRATVLMKPKNFAQHCNAHVQTVSTSSRSQ